ncbi:endo-beta- -glucanase d [Ophiostoma piceae UAMH 11346]|uniref:Endo-beta--glucanase d n=1 Tax=Ophiostoma piceae (strain UAMH 11346) TaxID=1262450 RepID=S3C109_OPHP1|nr:endo-beta- -glucanase d [Ophiostoma piceae UAMH 11346]
MSKTLTTAHEYDGSSVRLKMQDSGPSAFYVGCAQFDVVGATAAKTPPLTCYIPGPGKATDPGYMANVRTTTNTANYGFIVYQTIKRLAGAELQQLLVILGFRDRRSVLQLAISPNHKKEALQTNSVSAAH